ncbi:hypothetical protein I3F58_03260 [Streptomyces sp. MUM 203J]|uniref:hypothetical protein n=1 Tax=Streptomyces sp. MUM 203J TaxID=2791990 RepID=UPI001F033249|nr:hypothetical protein [Streptomyces sp. MUM 203J]MCH0538592.1 hypothetical protein [Streptomyces sp. MUM 203J]
MKTRRIRVSLAVAGVAGLGLLFPAVALAEGNDGPSANGSSVSQEEGSERAEEHRKHREERREQRDKELAVSLAADLGVSEDKVTEALEKFRKAKQDERAEAREERSSAESQEERATKRQERLKERLDDAVAEGELTREQADAVLAAAEAGALPGPGGRPGGQHPAHR